jgi:hypothetical protein
MTEAEIISQLADLARYLRHPGHDSFVALAIAERLQAQLLALAQADSDTP